MRHRDTSIVLLALALGCGGGELSVDDYHSSSAPDSTVGSNNASSNSASNTTSPPATNTMVPVGNNTPGTNNATSGNTNSETNSTTGTTGMTNGTNGDPAFHPMFVAVADFMREKCISCHSAGQNGNFQIAAATSTNDEVRVALDGVVSTRGNLLVDPGNPDTSQVFIMITNDAGEQFPPETIAIVEDWINADAPYFE